MKICRWLSLLLILVSGGLLAQEPSPAVRVRFEFHLKAKSDVPSKGSLVLQPLSRDGEPLSIALDSASSSISAKLAPGTGWEVSAEIPGFWAARKTLTLASNEDEVVVPLDLWPMGEISGTLVIREKGVARPAKITMTTLVPPAHLKHPQVPKGLRECPVDRKGRWSCELPAALYDVVLSAKGFSPVYRWGLQVPVHKALEFGAVELRRGSSVAGWIAVEDGALDPERCIVRLAPLAAAGARPEDLSRLERTAWVQKAQKDGFFQLTGLSSGNYVLEVSQPGYAAVHVSPVQVASGAESFVREPILLKRPLTMELAISPPLDWLSRPWRVTVTRYSEASARFAAPAFEGGADQDGRAVIAGQSPGRFAVEIEDSLGNRLYSNREIRIGGTGDARVPIEIEFVTVQGKITLGGNPLAATLWFGGRNGIRSVKMESDGEGHFLGVLPQGGRWNVEIEATTPKVETRTWTQVSVDHSDRGKAEIALPDTRVFGRVLDADGRPARQATVLCRSNEVDLFSVADDRGQFEVRAFPSGLAELFAQAASFEPGSNGTSLPVQIQVAEDRPTGPVELRLRRTRVFSGKVISSLGVLPGARVEVTTVSPAADSGGVAVTDLTGAFHVDLPERAQAAAVVVSSPTHALKAFRVTLDQGEVALQLPDQHGVLEIALPVPEKQMEADGQTLQVFVDGLPLSLATLMQWAQAQDAGGGLRQDVLRIPGMAPGIYLVCVAPPIHGLAASMESGSCDSGSLGEGGTLRLKPASMRSGRR